MNKFCKILVAAVAVSALSPLSASAVIDNPITLAVIQTYDRQLQANPQDYLTYFRRGNEYYRHDEYMRALEDMNQALRYAPTSDTDLRFQAYMIRAGIYNQTGRAQMALADLNSAIGLNAESFAAYNQRANTNFTLDNIAEAKADYQRLLRMRSTCVEGLLGMARCAVKENNIGIANDYLERAVQTDPNNPEVYIRRAAVRKMMANHNGAVEDLLLAISLNPNDSKAVAALVEYGNTNYAVTMAGLSNAVSLAPQNGLYRYLRATIAQAHFNYLSAIDDFEAIIDQRLYDYHGIYASTGWCLLGLSRYDEALDRVDQALSMTTNVADYYVLRSKILRALNRNDEAIAAAAQAVAVNREYVPGLVEMALNYIDKQDYDQANSLLGEAIMIESSNPELYMLRAWLLETYMNKPTAAAQFYEQVLELEGYLDDDIRSLRGFALLRLDRTSEADTWINRVLATAVDNDGLVNYYAACFYALRDDSDKAIACVERSLQAGYSDNHNWMNNTDGFINAGVLRDDLRFLRLMQKYNAIFGR